MDTLNASPFTLASLSAITVRPGVAADRARRPLGKREWQSVVARRKGGWRTGIALSMLVLAGCANLKHPAPAVPATVEVPAAPATTAVPSAPTPAPVLPPPPPPKIALALGGGAARGFAHVGVIKVLEAQGIVPDIIVGTSAGSLVGALYASGMSSAALQKAALAMEDSAVADFSMPNRGIIKGEALQDYVNRTLGNRVIERLPRLLAIVATDLQSGEAIVFRTGNTGLAVRASSSVPGVFQPARIGNRDYVDGGLVSPVPVRIARGLGADIVIAVDISARPREQKTGSSMEVLLQSFAIMGQSIAALEMREADVVVRPAIGAFSPTDFNTRQLTLVEGERAMQRALPQLKARLAAYAEAHQAAPGGQAGAPSAPAAASR